MAKPVARPGVLKGFQLKPASGSSGDDVVASAVDAQFTGAIQRSMKTSGFKGSQAQLITRLRNDDDLVSTVLHVDCRGLVLPGTVHTQQLSARIHLACLLRLSIFLLWR